MLGKLMKYEFYATGRIFLPLYAALIILTSVSRLLRLLNSNAPSIFSSAISVIMTVISIILMVGIFIVTLVLAIQRFRQNLLSNEGYLMMTLPLKTDSLILSKLFVTAVWAVASFVIVVFAVFIMVVTRANLSGIADFFRWLGETVAANPFRVGLYSFEAVVVIALTILSQAMMLFACLSLGMLVNKHRLLLSFGAYIAITTAMQTIFAVGMSILIALNIDDLFDRLFGDFSNFGISQVYIALIVVAQIIICAIYYVVTRYMLKNKLNLQ